MNSYIDLYSKELKRHTQSFVFTDSQRKFERYFTINGQDEYRRFNALVSINKLEFYLSNFHAGMAFNIVEDILVPVLVKHSLLSKEFLKKNSYQYTFFINGFKEFYPFTESIHYFKPKIIKSERGAMVESKRISTFWVNLVLPFFGYFSNITELIPYILDDQKLHEVINPIGRFQRKLIIYYLTSHPDYVLFKQDLLSRLDNPTNNTELENWRNATLEIIKSVEDLDPIYEWNKEYLVKKPIPLIVSKYEKLINDIEANQKPKGFFNRLWSS